MPDQTKTKRLYALFQRLSRLMRQAEYETGLNPAQWEALCYLSRCNQFSNTPTALTAYLNATKGTISQTLNALERKKLIAKQKNQQDPRKINLTLTSKGAQLIKQHQTIQDLFAPLLDGTAKQQAEIEQALETILKTQLARRQGASFGMCETCAHFTHNHDPQNKSTPHLCTLLNVPLSDKNKQQICAEHTQSL